MAETLRPLENSIILLVEDNRTNSEIMLQSLIKAGYTNVHHASDGKQAIDMTHSLVPDMVILDIVMPELDGFDYLATIRRIPLFKQLPIIVQTSLEAHDDKMRAFSLGASDFIEKPFHQSELLARIHVHLSNKLLHEAVVAQRSQMLSELKAAQSMQKRLLPSNSHLQAAEHIYNMTIAEHFEPSSMLGGDSWGLQPISKTRLGVYMVDFSGHGITAALNVFRLHTLIQEILPLSSDPGRFLTLLNQHLYALLERSEFATMFYGIIDVEAGTLEYASAASPPILLLKDRGEWLNHRAIPLAVQPNTHYVSSNVDFKSNHALILFSDCLIESSNKHGITLNENDIKAMAEHALGGEAPHAHSILRAILSGFRKHYPGPLHDDLTINIYRRN